MNIKGIQKKLKIFVSKRNWDQFHSPKNLSMALAVEASELLEIFQWLTEEQSRNMAKSKEDLESATQEIADVFIYLFLLADKLQIDIEKAILDKIALNERKYPVELSKNSSRKYNRR